MKVENWLSTKFWKDVFQQTIDWGIHAIPKLLLIFALAFVLLKLLGVGCRWLMNRAWQADDADDAHAAREQEKRLETLVGIVRKAGVVAIWALVSMLVLLQLGVNVAPLIASAGIIGLAIGFGSQELVRDMITGFFILLENHIRKGDVAIINGTGGLVENIGLRTVVLRDLSGTVHVFQNGKIDSLANMTKEWSAMVFDVGVAYKEDVDRVMNVMREVANELARDSAFADKILEPIEIFGVDSFDDSAVVVKARLKTVPIEQWNVGREYRRRLKQSFDERGIEIPFPHRTLYWGDRSPPLELGSARTEKSTNGRPGSEDRREPAPA